MYSVNNSFLKAYAFDYALLLRFFYLFSSSYTVLSPRCVAVHRRGAALPDEGHVACDELGASRRRKIHRIAPVIGVDPVITNAPGTRVALTWGISLAGVHLCDSANFRRTGMCPLEVFVIVSENLDWNNIKV